MLPSTSPIQWHPLGQPAHDKSGVTWKQPPLAHANPFSPGQFVALHSLWSQVSFTHVAPGAQHTSSHRRPHLPPQQTHPAGQAWPQMAQFAGSDWRSAHTWSQQACPPGQGPQLSVPPQPSAITAHWPGLQVVCGVQQLPSMQIWPGTQSLSQLPQFRGSVWRSVQISPQHVRLSPQHSPAAWQQNSSAQHIPPQQMSPSAWQHAEPQQVCPLGQHSPPQQVCPIAQQFSWQQTSPGAHTAPLCPQGAGVLVGVLV